ncbi:ABC transporter ATP-binding protein [Desulfonema magnum]|uniref:ABC transporter, ATP-binding protein n=1 Tax=Desulfonema magnum TaxID=45655 RepID=A0A975GST0_9BACT|nr:ABC transporter ATP-binding protein [Desulfonema magnum]QTA92247.1 putative ABC transporter, ATP-binding protein [Desulfonema magnum]
MLYIKAVQKSFDGFMAVNGANLSVDKGEIVAVIGPNGAGKTTLFSLITGQLKPDSGEIIFKNENIAGLPPYAICRKGISRSFQVVNIFNRLTVFENVQAAVLSHQKKVLNLFSPAKNMAVKETEELLESVGLTDKADSISGLLSHGDQKVLEMAIALGNRPELLILDEPTAGMSPEETAVSIDLIRRLSRELGLTILFCEHDIALVFSISHKIMVMQQGQTIIQGKPDEVRENKQVQEAYLGGAN